ncbi:hypothetical protein J416_13349 [Gracilibacillus halophilus YIM-C55.5]|uniref:Sodium/pantothenate symporter n=1 Tax=Gracilibacillus halophilus YIM-C55.5 TaxID=1308866 RepID=N4WS09_9BACI|nr:YhdT family protein [Gracilibacillus halophilus]ENH95966.1 hypothetical protein J416_13349 [Gracilibacillus halophilus YIM-C55.5]
MNVNKDRIKIAHKEALIGIGLVLFHFIWWFSFAYGLGSTDVDNYSYILGFPAWFFYSCIMGIIVMSIFVSLIVKLFFTEISLENEEFEDR